MSGWGAGLLWLFVIAPLVFVAYLALYGQAGLM